MLGTQQFRSRDQFLAYLSEAYSGERSKPVAFRSLHAFVLSLHSSFSLNEMVERGRRRGFPLSIANQGKDLFRFGLGVRTSHQVGFLTPVDEYWVFFSDGETAEVGSTISAFTRAMFPVLKSAYVPSGDLLQLLDRIADKYPELLVTEGTIGTLDATYRTWAHDPERYSRRHMEQEARKQNGKWAGISFRCLNGGRDLLSCRVYETGHLTLYSGVFSNFYEDSLLPYVSSADRFRRRLEGKERKDQNGSPVVSPIPIHLPRPVSLTEMDLLRGRILRRYAGAVMHAGNPMLMMQVTDSADGSAYDLYAYGQEVRIVPLQRASSASLSGLVALVSDVLPTGTVTSQ